MRLNNSAARDFRKKKKKAKSVDETFWPVVKEKLDIGLSLRRPFEREWIVNLAFLSGRQYVYFSTHAHMLASIQRVKGRPRKVDNKLMPKWRRQVANFIKADPHLVVVPENETDEAIAAAKLGTKVLKSFWQSKRMRRKRRQMGGWLYGTGNVFLDDRWNKKLGEITLDPQSGKAVYEGDVDAGIWSPFEVFVPSQTSGQCELNDLPWLGRIKWRDLDYFKENFKRGEEVMPEERPNPVLGASLLDGGLKAAKGASNIQGANLIELFLKPCKDYPKGCYIKAANTTVLEKVDWPYNEYRMEHFKDDDIPGAFWGRATMTDAVPLQVRWNDTLNNIESFNKSVGKGKILSPRRSRLEALPDDTHGEVLQYTPVMGYKPEYLKPPSLPATYDLTLNITNASLQDIFSQHEVSRGTNKSDIRSGTMVDLLLEQDAHGGIPSHELFEEGMEAWGSRILQRFAAGYKGERFLKLRGQDGEFEVFSFKGVDLQNSWQVSVKRQSSVPDSITLRNARVEARYQQGLYGDPADPETKRRVLNMLEDAVVNDIYGDVRLDEILARHENRLMQSGQIDEVVVNQYDNHRVHLAEHQRIRKKVEFQRLKVEEPQIFSQMEIVFQSHEMQHSEFIRQAEEQAMAREAQFQRMTKEGGGND